MEQNTAQPGSGIVKIIAVECVIIALLLIAVIAVRHTSIIYVHGLLFTAMAIIETIPFTYGIVWDTDVLSDQTRKLLSGIVFLAIVVQIVNTPIYIWHRHVAILGAIVGAVLFVAAIYIPFYIGRGVRLWLSRRR